MSTEVVVDSNGVRHFYYGYYNDDGQFVIVGETLMWR